MRQSLGRGPRPATQHRRFSGQSAMEYMATYGWALIVIALVAGAAYYFLLIPNSTAASQCVISSGLHCDDVAVSGYGSSGGSVALLLTNTQQYPIMDPSVNLSIGGTNTSASCMTAYAVAGGSVVCTVSTPVQLSKGQLVGGKFFVTARYCGMVLSPFNASMCGTAPKQAYLGTFTVQASGSISPRVEISLSASPNPGYSGSESQLVATVMFMGYPMKGATVNFSSNSSYAPINPASVTTDSSGNATAHIEPSSSGTVLVRASYSGASAALAMRFLQRSTISTSSTTSTTSASSTTSTGSSTTSTSTTSTSSTTTVSALLTGTVTPTPASVDSGNSTLLTAAWSCGTCTGPYTAEFYWSAVSGQCSAFTQFGSSAPVSSPNSILSPALSNVGSAYFCARLNDSSGNSNYTAVAAVAVNQPPVASLSITPTSLPLGSSTTLTASWAYGTPPYDLLLAAGTGQSCSALLANSVWSYSTGYGATSPYRETLTSGAGNDIAAAGNYMVCAEVEDNVSGSSNTGAIAIGVT